MQEERMEAEWNGEDLVKVRNRQQVLDLSLDPQRLIQTLTLGTVPIPARVIKRILPPTVIAPLCVSAQGGGATRDQGMDDASLVVAEVREIQHMVVEDVGQLRPCVPRTFHLAVRHPLHPGLLAPQAVERAPCLIEVVLSQMGVPLRGLETSVAEQGLDLANVGAVLQQVGSEAVPERVE